MAIFQKQLKRKIKHFKMLIKTIKNKQNVFIKITYKSIEHNFACHYEIASKPSLLNNTLRNSFYLIRRNLITED